MSKKKYTPKTAAAEMRRISNERDEIDGHEEGDALMCDILRSMGFVTVVEIFEDMDKYYA